MASKNGLITGFGAAAGLVFALFTVYLVWTFVVYPIAHPPPAITITVPPPQMVRVVGHVSPGLVPATHTIYGIGFGNAGNATFNNGNYSIIVPNGATYNVTEYWEYDYISGVWQGRGSCVYLTPLKVAALYNQTEIYFNITPC